MGESAAAHGKGFSLVSSSTGKLGQETCGWGHVYMGPAAAPAPFYREKGGADVWLSGNKQHQREGEALESTEKKEMVLKCGHSYRLQKGHKSVHFYDFFTPNWAQLHAQGQS